MSSKRRRRRGHYVSKLFTKGWEVEQRRLWVFDDARDQVRLRSSKQLFSDPRSTTSEFEARLNQLIETPIAAHLEELTDAAVSGGPVTLDDWSVYRALVLALMMQGARASTRGRDLENMADLERGLFSQDAVLDGFVQHWMEEKVLVRVATPSSCPLFYPEIGFFGFPVRDPGYASGHSFGFGLPLRPHIVFCLISETGDGEWLLSVNQQHAYLAQMSVGFSPHCERWVVPPVLAEGHSEKEIIAAVREMREQSTAYAKTVGAHMDTIQDIAGRFADALNVNLDDLDRRGE